MTAARVAVLVLIGAMVAVMSPVALAQEAPPRDPLERANAAFELGDFAAAELAARAALDSTDRAVKAEAWRVVGLSLYYLNRLTEAETALLEHLKLETDAHLDPAIHPQNAVAFFEGVRSRNQAEIDKHRPKFEDRRFLLTLVPPFGQFQNKQPTKGLIVGGLELGLLAGSIASFAVLRSWCNQTTRECPGREDDAKLLQAINIGVSLGFVGVYIYGVADGVRHYRKWKRDQSSLRRSLSWFVIPSGDGVAGGISARF